MNKERMNIMRVEELTNAGLLGERKITSFISDDNIWFKAKDLASAWGDRNPERATRKYVRPKHRKTFEEIQGVTELVTPSRSDLQSNTVFILEPGVYQLIFRSKLPIAEEFQDWVYEDILPSIRRKGYYALPSVEA